MLLCWVLRAIRENEPISLMVPIGQTNSPICGKCKSMQPPPRVSNSQLTSKSAWRLLVVSKNRSSRIPKLQWIWTVAGHVPLAHVVWQFVATRHQLAITPLHYRVNETNNYIISNIIQQATDWLERSWKFDFGHCSFEMQGASGNPKKNPTHCAYCSNSGGFQPQDKLIQVDSPENLEAEAGSAAPSNSRSV